MLRCLRELPTSFSFSLGLILPMETMADVGFLY